MIAPEHTLLNSIRAWNYRIEPRRRQRLARSKRAAEEDIESLPMRGSVHRSGKKTVTCALFFSDRRLLD
jgi:hypothetical protein